MFLQVGANQFVELRSEEGNIPLVDHYLAVIEYSNDRNPSRKNEGTIRRMRGISSLRNKKMPQTKIGFIGIANPKLHFETFW